jgi:hypothetical protein
MEKVRIRTVYSQKRNWNTLGCYKERYAKDYTKASELQRAIK